MKVSGKSLMIRIGGKTVALATNCSVDAVLQTIDARTKSDDGAYEIGDYVSYSISSESVIGMNAGVNQQTYATLMDILLAKIPVDVEVMIAANARLGIVPGSDWTPGPISEKGFASYGGKALVKQVTANAPVQGNATMTVQLSGIGALVKIEQGPVVARVEGTTLYIDGPAEVNAGLRIDGELVINDNTIEL